MTMAEFLKHKLADQNLSDVARKIGVNRSLLHQWVSGKRIPSMANIKPLQKLAEHLNLSLEELLLARPVNETITTVSFKDEKRVYRIKIERVE